MIINLDEFKQYLNITTDEQDNFLSAIIKNADERIKSYLNRNLEIAYYTEIYSGNLQEIITLREYPVLSIDKVEFWDNENWINAQEQGYNFIITNNNTSLRILNGTFPDGNDNVRISYTAGYDVIPADIKFYCLELASLYFKTSFLGNNNIGITNRTRGEISENFDLEAENRIISKLKYYRKFNV